MSSYRYTRNIEASVIDKLTTDFNADWTGVNVEKTFARIYSIDMPSICVRVGPTSHEFVEIGDNNTWRKPQLLIDIFATSDGQKLDLTDYIVEKIKNGFVYYDYVINNGVVQTKTQNGRIRVISIEVTHINFDEDKATLDEHDRYRALITCEISLGRVET
jgi:hypothetical protein